MCHVDLVQPRCLQSQLQGVGDVLGLHRGAQLPGNDVAGEVVEHGRQIEPTPASHLQISEVGLPSWFGAVVLSLNSSAAFITMKAGLVIRSWALSRRYTEASDTKWRSASVKRTASSRGESSGSSRANVTIRARTSSGMRFHTRSGRGLQSSSASGPPV